MPAKTYLKAAIGAALLGAVMAGAGAGLAQTAPAGAAPAAPALDLDHAKQTLENVCANCHDIAIVTEARYSRSEWQNVIQRMQSFGLSATQDEIKEITEYLAATYHP